MHQRGQKREHKQRKCALNRDVGLLAGNHGSSPALMLAGTFYRIMDAVSAGMGAITAASHASRLGRWFRKESDDMRSVSCSLAATRLEASSMKLADLVDHMASEAGIQKDAAKKAVDAVFAGIVEAAKKGEEVNLAGFGKFKVKDSQARQGRNPSTGEIIEIAASRKLGFSSAKQVKDALAG